MKHISEALRCLFVWDLLAARPLSYRLSVLNASHQRRQFLAKQSLERIGDFGDSGSRCGIEGPLLD
jgi:hypothetical protein